MPRQLTPAAPAAQMRTTIRETSSGTVRLTAINPYSGELMDETYYVPNDGGYVRVIERGYGTDPQVCGELGRRGYTLEAPIPVHMRWCAAMAAERPDDA